MFVQIWTLYYFFQDVIFYTLLISVTNWKSMFQIGIYTCFCTIWIWCIQCKLALIWKRWNNQFPKIRLLKQLYIWVIPVSCTCNINTRYGTRKLLTLFWRNARQQVVVVSAYVRFAWIYDKLTYFNLMNQRTCCNIFEAQKQFAVLDSIR
jgi:hypothetical protein